MKWLKNWLRPTLRQPAPRPAVKPALEPLEQRLTPAVTYHGGGVLPHVEVQALYYGSDWYANQANYQTTGKIENYLRYLVNSPYMDMLTNAGYGVGRGSFSQGRIVQYNINKGYYLDDSTIENNLVSLIRSGTLQRNDANRLYVVFVEPGVAVKMGGGDSIHTFLGYHWNDQGVAYAVIPYQAGFNAHYPAPYSAFDSLTAVTSHELAEAVTDPQPNYRLGWFDDAFGRTHQGEGEIGDIVNGQVVRLNGYLVQKEAGKNDQALSPAGSTAYSAYMNTSGGGIGMAASVASSAARLPKGWLAILDITPPAKGKGASLTAHEAADGGVPDGRLDRPVPLSARLTLVRRQAALRAGRLAPSNVSGRDGPRYSKRNCMNGKAYRLGGTPSGTPQGVLPK